MWQWQLKAFIRWRIQGSSEERVTDEKERSKGSGERGIGNDDDDDDDDDDKGCGERERGVGYKILDIEILGG